jgi:hypothetical protein
MVAARYHELCLDMERGWERGIEAGRWAGWRAVAVH